MKKQRQIIKRLNKKISLIQNKEIKKSLSLISKELSKYMYETYMQAITDPKTGVYNNHFFSTILEMEIEKARRGSQKFSLLILDLDNFKKINDTYGHVKGDFILTRLATIITKNTRKFDIISRFGGEEFTILFPGTSLRKSKKLCQRIQEEVRGDIFLKKFNVTFSGGLTKFKKEDNSTKILERVDKGLYKAKDLGKDRFIVMD